MASSSPPIRNFATAAAVLGFFVIDFAIALDAQVNVAEFNVFVLAVGILVAVVGEQSSLNSPNGVRKLEDQIQKPPAARYYFHTHALVIE